jgi:hypothetical protein
MTSSPNVVGSYEYYVFNKNTGKVYDVLVDVEGDVLSGGQHVRSIAGSVLTDAVTQSAFVYWQAKFEDLSFYLEAPDHDGYGITSFVEMEQASVCLSFAGSQDFGQMAAKARSAGVFSMAFSLFKTWIGAGPKAAFVFGNGDVATFELNLLTPGSTGCKYQKGSARNALGEFIPDQHAGGNNHSNGSDYVQAGNHMYWLAITHTLWVSCSYMTDSQGHRTFIGCIYDTPP